MRRTHSFAPGEHYHLYNRGAHKAEIFRESADYERFMLLLYLANDSGPFEFRNLASKYKGKPFTDMYEGEERKQDLVGVFAYALMPNHFHLVVQEKTENGIERFMRKVMTGYSMYFNLKHDHSGVLFQGRFKSKYVGEEDYFRWIFSYVHLNPIERIAPDWEKGAYGSIESVRSLMLEYPYSSYLDYRGKERPHSRILAREVPDFLREQDDLADMLSSFTKDGPPYNVQAG